MAPATSFDWQAWLETLGMLDEQVRLASLTSYDAPYRQTAGARCKALAFFLAPP